ncbi:MAG: S41 family peptidase [Myxococcota bacterium]
MRHAFLLAVVLVSPVERTAMSRSDAAADLRTWWSVLWEVHPEPDANIERDDLERAFRATLDTLPEHLTPEMVYSRLARLSALLGDSHTTIRPPGGTSPRLPIVVHEGRAFLNRPYGPLPAGAEVRRIGGHPVEQLFDWGRPHIAAELPSGVDEGLPLLVPAALRAFGRRNNLVEVRANHESMSAPYEPTPEPKEFALSGYWLEGDIAMLRVRTMSGIFEIESYDRWLAAFFQEVANRSARGLVIDLRDNRGGSTLVGELVLMYVAEEPFRMFGEKRWKVSRRMQASLEGQGFVDYEQASPGEVLVQVPALREPPPHPLRFHGPVAFLIGPQTLSSAMMTANAVEDFGLGLLVGRPTSTPPNYFGEVYSFRLPRTGLEATFSTARFVRANGDASDPNAVQPDRLVPFGPQSLSDERDWDLRTALHALRGQ